MSARKVFFLLSRIAFEPTRRRVSRRTNKPTRVNERETTKWRFSLSTISRGCKTHLPLLFPFRWASRRWEGWRAFSPSVPTPRSDTSLRPFSSTASSTSSASSLPDSSLGDAPFSGGRARTALSSVPLGSRPLPPPVRPLRVEIYSSCPPLRVVTHEVM